MEEKFRNELNANIKLSNLYKVSSRNKPHASWRQITLYDQDTEFKFTLYIMFIKEISSYVLNSFETRERQQILRLKVWS